jgi:hypothetical protein
MVAPDLAVAAEMVLTPVAPPAVTMEIPARTPPHQPPLRPTSIVTAAIHTPLHLPTVPTAPAEAVVNDEGMIESPLVHTAEQSRPDAVTPETVLTDDGELPWIDAFRASTPTVPLAAVPMPLANTLVGEEAANPPAVAATGGDVERWEHAAPVESAEHGGGKAADAEGDVVIAEAALADQAEADQAEAPEGILSAADGETAPVETWPLEDAVAQFRELSAQYDSAVSSFENPEELFAEVAAPEPLPAWSDDDMMDIMPIRHMEKTLLSSPAGVTEGEVGSERARMGHDEERVLRAMASTEGVADPSEATPSLAHATAEEAAHALELLARRVRAGELMLPGYDPRMGESAALVAALAAILGVRFR